MIYWATIVLLHIFQIYVKSTAQQETPAILRITPYGGKLLLMINEKDLENKTDEQLVVLTLENQEYFQADFWSQPESGRLAGFVLSKNSDNEFIILDKNQNEWKVQLEQNENFPPVEIQIGKPIRVVGKKIGEYIFSAKRVMSVGPGRRFFMRHKDKHLPMFAKPPVKMRGFENEPRFKGEVEKFSGMTGKIYRIINNNASFCSRIM